MPNSVTFLTDYCQRINEPSLKMSDFNWNYTFEEMLKAFDFVYHSEKVLPARAYWDSKKQSYFLPYLKDRGGDVRLPASFIENVVNHIETAFDKKYIDAVFFPDMGHSHFLIPESSWNTKYNPIPVSNFSNLYTLMMEDSDLKILYHTAEQLRLTDETKKVINDPYIKWRHNTRNIVGSNDSIKNLLILQNPESYSNTVSSLRNYFWYGGGFNISSHKDGCFAYKKNGIVYRFDMSLFDLEDN